MLPTRILLAVVALISMARGDWLLDDYSFAARDSAGVQAAYGIVGFHNPSSVVKTEVSGGAVRLVASKIASDSTEGYSANIGLRHPLTPDGSVHDLSGLDSVRFEYRNSSKITDVFRISFLSPLYADSGYREPLYRAEFDKQTELAPRTEWTRVSIAIQDFGYPWHFYLDPGLPSLDSVLKRIDGLEFQPLTLYNDTGTQNGTACTKCITPTMDSLTLEIRNIVLVGVDKYPLPNPGRIGCTGESEVLDKTFDNTKNELGGNWFKLSDFDSLGTSTDQTKGSSKSSFELLEGDEFATGFITLKTELDKLDKGQWHRDAGWAAIGTYFGGCRSAGGGITGMQFRIKADSLPAAVEGIRFKVGLMGVSDTATHSVMIPASTLKTAGAGGVDVCIRPDDLTQGNLVKEEERSDFDPRYGIKQLAWEARIADRRDSTLSRADVKFSLGDVRLYGYFDFCIAVQPRSPSHPFAITYANGSLNLRGLTGITTVDIFSLDGHRLASFAPASRIPLRLARGTWILAAHRHDGTVSTQPFVVAGP